MGITELTAGQAVFYAVLGITVVMSVLAVLSLLLRVLSRAFPAPREAPALREADDPGKPFSAAPNGGAEQAPVELVNTDEPTAALLMAIVSESCGIDLEYLQFKRIRLLGNTEEETQ
jgi:Na+-transporting methylmalonyl-CoA/oxaloacetate decarboxylase gamma subunit